MGLALAVGLYLASPARLAGNPGDAPGHAVEAPRLRVWRLGEPGPSRAGEVLKEVTLSPWAWIFLAAGDSWSGAVSLEAPEEPGWYVAELKLRFVHGENEGETGAGVRFLVSYPEGEMRDGSVVVNGSVTEAGHTVTVKTLTLTPKKTVVHYTVTNVPVPCGFDVSLVTREGFRLAELGGSQWEAEGALSAEAVFGPTPTRATGLTFEIGNLPEYGESGRVDNPGPWRVEIPLPDSP